MLLFEIWWDKESHHVPLLYGDLQEYTLLQKKSWTSEANLFSEYCGLESLVLPGMVRHLIQALV